MERGKKIIIFLFVLAVIIASVFLVRKFVVRKNTAEPNTVNNSSNSVIDTAKQREFEDAIKKTAASDQDLDGIADTEESTHKTDPASSDTDSDGLTDWQEISIYQTDPLKNDTDSDTFLDGYEVRRGFNPKGAGKL